MKTQLTSIFRSSILLSLICLGLQTYSQVTVVVNPNNTIVCFRDSVAFTSIVTGAGTSKISFQWQKNFIDISGATDSIYAISHVLSSSPGIYRCMIQVQGLGGDTSNDAMLRMHPRMYIDTLFRYNPLGCLVDCKGQFKVKVSGGTPFKNGLQYMYEWSGGHSQDTIVFGLCPRSLPYTFTATDSLGCSIDSAYFVDFLKSPKITLGINIIYPTLTMSFQDSIQNNLTNWMWNFGDGGTAINGNPVTHTYQSKGDYKLLFSFTDINGCDSVISEWIHNWPWGIIGGKISQRFKIFPNPASEKITIEVSDSICDIKNYSSIMISTFMGKELISQPIQGKRTEINIRGLPSGIYFFRLLNNEHLLLDKFIKE